MAKLISIEIISCILLLICSFKSSTSVAAERIFFQKYPKTDSIHLKSLENHLARQQIQATPYPSADALKPEIPFEEGKHDTVAETQDTQRIPDPIYGPPEPDLIYGPPSKPHPTLTKQIPLNQLPSENEPVDFIAPLLLTSGDLVANDLPDIQITQDNYCVGNDDSDLLLDSKQLVPVFYTNEFTAKPWSWFPSKSSGSYSYAYFHRNVPSNIAWQQL